MAFRRGWTHGVLAMVVLPLALAGGMRLWARWRPPRDGPPLRAGPLLALSCVAVWSHPALDWLNTYGVRLLMPFDGRWFYGDAVYIVDPWLWLLAGAAVVLARSRGRRTLAGWVVLGTAMTGLVLWSGRVPLLGKLVWAAAVLTLTVARWRRGPMDQAPRVALASLAVLALYIGAMIDTTAWARAEATRALTAAGTPPEQLIVGPVAAQPTRRTGVARIAKGYVFFDLDRLDAPDPTAASETPTGAPPAAAAAATAPAAAVNWSDKQTTLFDYQTNFAQAGAAIEGAKAAPGVQGYLGWARFPHFSAEQLSGGYRVWIRDLRYAAPGQTHGFGIAVVDLDAELHPTASTSMRR